jgi:hypothetical protein
MPRADRAILATGVRPLTRLDPWFVATGTKSCRARAGVLSRLRIAVSFREFGSKKSTGHMGVRRNLANHVRSNRAGGDADTLTFAGTSYVPNDMLPSRSEG